MRLRKHGLRLSTPIQCGILTFIAGLCLVVIWPVFATSRGSRRDPCLSNVKQMSLSVLMYLQDYDERMPPAATWMDVTYPYSRNRQIYHCPEILSSHKTDFGYAFNTLLSLQPYSDIKSLRETPMLYDSNDLRWNANAPGSSDLANPPRHSSLDHVGFADGYTRSIKPSIKKE